MSGDGGCREVFIVAVRRGLYFFWEILGEMGGVLIKSITFVGDLEKKEEDNAFNKLYW